MSKARKQFYPSNIDGMSVDCRIHNLANNMIQISVRLINGSTGKSIRGFGWKRKVLPNWCDTTDYINGMICALEKEYRKTMGKKVLISGEVSEYLHKVIELHREDISYHLRFADSTFERALPRLKRMVSHFESYGFDKTSAQEFLDTEIKHALNHKNYSGDRTSTENRVKSDIQLALRIYQYIREYLDPLKTLPAIVVDLTKAKAMASNEQLKELPDEIIASTTLHFLSDFKSGNNLGLAALFQLYGLMRCSEAVAVCCDCVTLLPDQHCILRIDRQVGRDGTLTHRLKRPASYRSVVIPLFLSRIVCERLSILESVRKGAKPIIGYRDENNSFYRGTDLSSYVSSVFSIYVDDFETLHKIPVVDAEELRNDDQPLDAASYCSHLLRRTGISRLLNCTSLDRMLVKQIAGHELPRNVKKISLTNHYEEICEAIEKLVRPVSLASVPVHPLDQLHIAGNDTHIGVNGSKPRFVRIESFEEFDLFKISHSSNTRISIVRAQRSNRSSHCAIYPINEKTILDKE